MRYVQVLWDDDDNRQGNAWHIAAHELTKEDVEHVLQNPTSEAVSRSTGRPCVFGYTPDGEFILVVYEERNKKRVIYPITAYPVDEP